jgi:chemotaxis protein MotB
MAGYYGALSNKMDVMQESYNALEKTVTKLQINMSKIVICSQLDAKGKALAIEQERLNKSAQRLQELESLIAAKEATMKN